MNRPGGGGAYPFPIDGHDWIQQALSAFQVPPNNTTGAVFPQTLTPEASLPPPSAPPIAQQSPLVGQNNLWHEHELRIMARFADLAKDRSPAEAKSQGAKALAGAIEQRLEQLRDDPERADRFRNNYSVPDEHRHQQQPDGRAAHRPEQGSHYQGFSSRSPSPDEGIEVISAQDLLTIAVTRETEKLNEEMKIREREIRREMAEKMRIEMEQVREEARQKIDEERAKMLEESKKKEEKLFEENGRRTVAMEQQLFTLDNKMKEVHKEKEELKKREETVKTNENKLREMRIAWKKERKRQATVDQETPFDEEVSTSDRNNITTVKAVLDPQEPNDKSHESARVEQDSSSPIAIPNVTTEAPPPSDEMKSDDAESLAADSTEDGPPAAKKARRHVIVMSTSLACFSTHTWRPSDYVPAADGVADSDGEEELREQIIVDEDFVDGERDHVEMRLQEAIPSPPPAEHIDSDAHCVVPAPAFNDEIDEYRNEAQEEYFRERLKLKVLLSPLHKVEQEIFPVDDNVDDEEGAIVDEPAADPFEDAPESSLAGDGGDISPSTAVIPSEGAREDNHKSLTSCFIGVSQSSIDTPYASLLVLATSQATQSGVEAAPGDDSLHPSSSSLNLNLDESEEFRSVAPSPSDHSAAVDAPASSLTLDGPASSASSGVAFHVPTSSSHAVDIEAINATSDHDYYTTSSGMCLEPSSMISNKGSPIETPDYPNICTLTYLKCPKSKYLLAYKGPQFIPEEQIAQILDGTRDDYKSFAYAIFDLLEQEGEADAFLRKRNQIRMHFACECIRKHPGVAEPCLKYWRSCVYTFDAIVQKRRIDREMELKMIARESAEKTAPRMKWKQVFKLPPNAEEQMRPGGRPEWSSKEMAALALLSSNSRAMQVNEIYQSIIEWFPYYGNTGLRDCLLWRKSVRNCLANNSCFAKQKGKDTRSSTWSIEPEALQGVIVALKEKLQNKERQNCISSIENLELMIEKSDKSQYQPQKPLCSYSELASFALITSTMGTLHVQDINYFIMNMFPYFASSKASSTWQHDVLNALNTYKRFQKPSTIEHARYSDDGYWRLSPTYKNTVNVEVSGIIKREKIPKTRYEDVQRRIDKRIMEREEPTKSEFLAKEKEGILRRGALSEGGPIPSPVLDVPSIPSSSTTPSIFMLSCDAPVHDCVAATKEAVCPGSKNNSFNEMEPPAGATLLKPEWSYAEMIALVLRNSNSKGLKVPDIYQLVIKRFPYFATAPAGWRNSIRHTLCFSKWFRRLDNPTRQMESIYCIKPEKNWKVDEALRKRQESEHTRESNGSTAH